MRKLSEEERRTESADDQLLLLLLAVGVCFGCWRWRVGVVGPKHSHTHRQKRRC